MLANYQWISRASCWAFWDQRPHIHPLWPLKFQCYTYTVSLTICSTRNDLQVTGYLDVLFQYSLSSKRENYIFFSQGKREKKKYKFSCNISWIKTPNKSTYFTQTLHDQSCLYGSRFSLSCLYNTPQIGHNVFCFYLFISF